MELEGANFQYLIGDSSPTDSFFEDDAAISVERNGDFQFHVRYVVKNLWKRLSCSKKDNVAHAKLLCLAKCGITSQRNMTSLSTLFSPYSLSDREAASKVVDSSYTEPDWSAEYGLFWPAAGHWLDDSRRLASYQFEKQDVIELQHRNNLILLPMLNYFENYAEGYLLKKCGKGLSQSWSLRWFCLRGNVIYYSRKPRDSSCAILNIQDSFIFVEENELCPEEDGNWRFSIKIGCKSLNLKATTFHEYDHWRRIFKGLQTKNLEEHSRHKKSFSLESAISMCSKSTEVSRGSDSQIDEDDSIARTKSLLTRHELFSKSHSSLISSHKDSKTAELELKKEILVKRAHFQVHDEPELVYIGLKPKMLYLFRKHCSDNENERTVSLSNAYVEIEHSTGRFMFIFNLKEYNEDRTSTSNRIIGKLHVENDNEMRMWRIAFMERAEIQTSLGNIKTVVSEVMSLSRPSTPVSEFDDGYSTSSPTTPTSLYGSNLMNFPSTPSKNFTRSRQSLKEDAHQEIRRTRSPSTASTNKYQLEEIDASRSGAATPTSSHSSTYKIVKKASQRFPVTFWRRRGSIV